MADEALLDHDVISKVACYAFGEAVFALLAELNLAPQALAVSKFVLPGKIARSKRISDKEAALARLAAMINALALVEPGKGELQLAAEFEVVAQQLNVDLDPGESQLLALLVAREAQLLLTGDKRAIAAIEAVCGHRGQLAEVAGKVACAEQLAFGLMNRHGLPAIRAGVCSEPGADIALSACFSCATTSPLKIEDAEAGLSSYVGHVRSLGPSVLRASDAL